MKTKFWGRVVAPVVAALSVAVLAQPADAAIRIAWRPTVLPLPAGSGYGFLTGSNGQGEYTGTFVVNGVQTVVSWRNGQPVVRGVPSGYEAALANDENPSGVVAGTVHDYDTRISRAYTLDATGFHIRDVPAGYDYVYGIALNARGDLLGRATKFGGGEAAVLWRADGSAPVLIPSTPDTYYARDLDEDGTIMFDSGYDSVLWKDGVLRHLSPSPANQAWGYAIRNGVVVGTAIWGSGEQAVRWSSPTSPMTELPGGGRALSVNKAGLTAGLVPNPSGPVIVGNATVWRTTTPGEVRAPSGYSTFEAKVAADDGSLAGFATNGSRDAGGVPVVWRLTP
ncbi:hypothetical protein [Amycolatopsis lexingtonensis]|uniref:hypothetical protein n=1 Tax=Amycolatopsis lexingtonensis TaxID=218822 RepID=UPI003F710581